MTRQQTQFTVLYTVRLTLSEALAPSTIEGRSLRPCSASPGDKLIVYHVGSENQSIRYPI